MNFVINNQADMDKFAQDFVLKLSPRDDRALVVGLYGDLGAGKTFLTGKIAKILGVEDAIVSPTFVIEKIYPIRNIGLVKPISNGTGEKVNYFTHLIHIDAYRLEASSELLNLGWKNIISDPQNLILIEWPEKVADIMPPHIKIHIKHTESEEKREVFLEML